MALSTRQEILAEFERRLSAIDGTPPFQTSAGLEIYRNEVPNLGPDDAAAAIAIITEPDSVGWQKQNLLIDLPVAVAALARVSDTADVRAATKTVEAVVADIKRAVELEDRRLGLQQVDSRGIKRGSTSTLARQDGSTTVGAAINYDVTYVEAWGNP